MAAVSLSPAQCLGVKFSKAHCIWLRLRLRYDINILLLTTYLSLAPTPPHIHSQTTKSSTNVLPVIPGKIPPVHAMTIHAIIWCSELITCSKRWSMEQRVVTACAMQTCVSLVLQRTNVDIKMWDRGRERKREMNSKPWDQFGERHFAFGWTMPHGELFHWLEKKCAGFLCMGATMPAIHMPQQPQKRCFIQPGGNCKRKAFHAWCGTHSWLASILWAVGWWPLFWLVWFAQGATLNDMTMSQWCSDAFECSGHHAIMWGHSFLASDWNDNEQCNSTKIPFEPFCDIDYWWRSASLCTSWLYGLYDFMFLTLMIWIESLDDAHWLVKSFAMFTIFIWSSSLVWWHHNPKQTFFTLLLCSKERTVPQLPSWRRRALFFAGFQGYDFRGWDDDQIN